ncbi:hypothetical protein DL769_011402 [Monosporascus sp. CRB-8-3]|nr:hypothetical protein DL769_011402 [Monosporascus sp. CRB-8-3]
MASTHPFQDKIIAITGASRSTGLALSRYLFGRGAKVSMAATSEENLAKAVAELEKEMRGVSDRILTKATDVSKFEDVKTWIDTTVEKWGPLDGAANVAAKMNHRIWPIETFPLGDLHEMLNVNLIGTFNCLKEMKNMKRGGSIVNCGRQPSSPPNGQSRTMKECRSDMAVLLYIPRELRDLIIGLVLLPGRPAPIDHDASGLTRAPIVDVYFASWNESNRVMYEPESTTPAATPLLLVNRQPHSETKDALERIPGRGRSYALDLVLAKEEVLWPTWTLVPAYSQHVDSVDVTVRIVDAMGALPVYHKWDQWHSIFGGGDAALQGWFGYSTASWAFLEGRASRQDS